MKWSIGIYVLLLTLLTGCINFDFGEGKQPEEEKTTDLPTNYKEALQKRALKPKFLEKELFRFLVLNAEANDPEASLFFSIREKTKNYSLDAGYLLCTSSCPGKCDLECKPLYKERFMPFEKGLKEVFKNPRLANKQNKKETVFFFQHHTDETLLIEGSASDVFAIELALAFLRLAEYDQPTIRYFEDMKGRQLVK